MSRKYKKKGEAMREKMNTMATQKQNTEINLRILHQFPA